MLSPTVLSQAMGSVLCVPSLPHGHGQHRTQLGTALPVSQQGHHHPRAPSQGVKPSGRATKAAAASRDPELPSTLGHIIPKLLDLQP